MANQNQLSKLKIPLLIIALLVILGGGGFAIWSVTRREDQGTERREGAEGSPVGGRVDASGLYTAEELAYNPLFDENSPDRTPEYEAVLVTSSEGHRLIEDRMRKIQTHRPTIDKIRLTHQIGRNLVNNTLFSPQANKAVQKMFDLVDGVTGSNYKTYPVYGKFEPNGAALKADINNFLAQDGQGYNVSNARHKGNAWWFGSVYLNLMYGSNKSHLHSVDKIWWGAGGQEMRDGLDFFKLVNGHDVSDHRLLKGTPDGKQGIFAAWNMYNFVKQWKAAIDHLDTVTRQAAIDALEKEGKIRLI